MTCTQPTRHGVGEMRRHLKKHGYISIYFHVIDGGAARTRMRHRLSATRRCDENLVAEENIARFLRRQGDILRDFIWR